MLQVLETIALLRPSKSVVTTYSLCIPSFEALLRSPGLHPPVIWDGTVGTVAGSREHLVEDKPGPAGSVAPDTETVGTLVYQPLLPFGEEGDSVMLVVGVLTAQEIVSEPEPPVPPVWMAFGEGWAGTRYVPPPPPAPASAKPSVVPAPPGPPPTTPAPPPPPPASTTRPAAAFWPGQPWVNV